MDKFRRVQKDDKKEPTPEDLLRVTSAGRVSNYITYASKLLTGEDPSAGTTSPKSNKEESLKKLDSIRVSATGNAITKAVQVAEVLKRRFVGLHQRTEIGLIEIIDEYEPVEEGLENVTNSKQVSNIIITLSRSAEGMDKKDVGYQEPLPEDEVKEFQPGEMSRGGRGRSRKGSGYRGGWGDRSQSPGGKGGRGGWSSGGRKGGWSSGGGNWGNSGGRGNWGGKGGYGGGKGGNWGGNNRY